MFFCFFAKEFLGWKPKLWAWQYATWGHTKSFCAPGASCILHSQQSYSGLDVSKQMFALANDLSPFIIAFMIGTRKITKVAYHVLFCYVSMQ